MIRITKKARITSRVIALDIPRDELMQYAIVNTKKGLISLEEYEDCIPDNTSGMSKPASYNEGHSEGYSDGFASYSCN